MTTQPKPLIRYFRTSGNSVPGWLWEALHSAEKIAEGSAPVVIILPKTDRQRTLVVLDLDDWNDLSEARQAIQGGAA